MKALRGMFTTGLCTLAVSGTLPAILSAAPAANADINSAMAPIRAPFDNAILEAHHSGKCMDVQVASNADGATVQQWTCFADRTNQKWNFTALDNGYYNIRAVHSGKCLDVEVASNDEGHRVQQWTCFADRTNQQWRLAQRPNGYFALIARHSGKCLEVPNASVADGATLVQRTCASDRPYQEWRLR